jgi:hypothetical protein
MTRELLIDVGERVAVTAVEAFVAVLLANAAGMTDVATLQAAGLAALAASLSVIKGFAASRMGDGSAAFLPAPKSDPPGE